MLIQFKLLIVAMCWPLPILSKLGTSDTRATPYLYKMNFFLIIF